MEQLSHCLDLSVKKYDELNNGLKDQSEYSKHVKSVIEKINKTMENRSWSEIGFFIFAGFLVGLIVGSSAMTCVFWITFWITKRSMTPTTVPNTQVVADEPNDSQPNLQSVSQL